MILPDFRHQISESSIRQKNQCPFLFVNGMQCICNHSAQRDVLKMWSNDEDQRPKQWWVSYYEFSLILPLKIKCHWLWLVVTETCSRLKSAWVNVFLFLCNQTARTTTDLTTSSNKALLNAITKYAILHSIRYF